MALKVNPDMVTVTDNTGQDHPFNPFTARTKEIRKHVGVLERRREFLLGRIEANRAAGLQSRVDWDAQEVGALEDAIYLLEAAWDAVARVNRLVRQEAQEIARLAKRPGARVGRGLQG